jgi:hypothetical protein
MRSFWRKLFVFEEYKRGRLPLSAAVRPRPMRICMRARMTVSDRPRSMPPAMRSFPPVYFLAHKVNLLDGRIKKLNGWCTRVMLSACLFLGVSQLVRRRAVQDQICILCPWA